MFPSPMGIFFVSIICTYTLVTDTLTVSVPYGDLFCFYNIIRANYWYLFKFPSPMGIFFVSMVSKNGRIRLHGRKVSVPYGDLFCFYENCTSS